MITDCVSPIWGEVLGYLVSNQDLRQALVGAITVARARGEFSFPVRADLINQVEKMGYSRSMAVTLVNQSVDTVLCQLSLQANDGRVAL